MTRCPESISPDCPGHEHWERFGDCLTTVLYRAECDDQTGNVDGFRQHAMLFIQTMDETIDPVYPGDPKVTIPGGTFCLLITTEFGAVTRLDYDTAQAAQDAFDLIEQAYGLYCMEAEMREYAITSSTGRVGR